MKALKIIGGIIAVVAAIWLVMCAMGPARFDSGASMEMDAPASFVYNTISDLNTWQEWGPWMAEDPNMTTTMGEKTKGLGASYSWESDKMGGGNMEIVETVENKSMKTKLQFGGFDGFSFGDWAIEETDGKSNVSWGMKGDTDIPFLARGFMTLQGDQTKFFEQGLSNIKEIVEKQAAEAPKTYGGYTVNQLDMPTKNFVMHREKIAMADMAQFYGTHLSAIAGGVAKAGGEMDGMPYGIYYEWDEENKMTDMAAAIPVKTAMEMEGYTSLEVPAGKVLEIDYYGAYEGGGKAHYAMDEYMKANGVESSLVMEEYVTDPSSEPDTSKWLTKIYYVVKTEAAEEATEEAAKEGEGE